MVYQLLAQQLGAEPVDKMLQITGDWGLRFLLITLAITPIRQRLKKNWVTYRRMLGLFAFFYATSHLLIYVAFEQSFNLMGVLHEAIEKKYLFVGMSALLLMTPLAVTSTKRMMKKLGKNWTRLHKLIYPITALVILHFTWQVKSDYTEPVIYSLLFIGLLLLRKRAKKSTPQSTLRKNQINH